MAQLLHSSQAEELLANSTAGRLWASRRAANAQMSASGLRLEVCFDQFARAGSP